MNKKTTKIVFLGILVSVAMIFSYIEHQIPAFVAFPGIKLGLPNIAIIVVLYRIGWKEAICVNLIRVLLVSILFGTTLSLLYSVAGATLSLLIMIIMKNLKMFSKVFVSISGAIAHNIGQVLVAVFVTETAELLYYLPFLVITAVVSGVLIGLIGTKVVEKLERIEI